MTMQDGRNRRHLGFASVAVMLISVHYGIGFIIGTGEKVYVVGSGGSLYAVSTGLGILAMLLLARFYWIRFDPIWTLLGRRYGRRVKMMVGFLSWTWMIGVVAAQLMGGAYIAGVMGVAPFPTMLVLVLVIASISLWPVEKIARALQVLLLAGTLALVYALSLVGGVGHYFQSAREFPSSLASIGAAELIAVPMSTILLTVIGMDFHQFVVRAKNPTDAWLGCALAGVVLILLAFLPSAVVSGAGATDVIPSEIEAKQIIPIILLWAGDQSDQPIGFLLVVSLFVTAVGSGAGVLRIMNKTILDFTMLTPSLRNQFFVVVGNALIILAVALTGKMIVNLIVSFYAIYVAGVLIPFIAYALQEKRKVTISSSAICLSSVMGGVASTAILILSQFLPIGTSSGRPELWTLVGGITSSILGLFIGKCRYGRQLYKDQGKSMREKNISEKR